LGARPQACAGSLRCPQRHGRVAFPLPHIPLVFRARRPKLYAEHPCTLGEHLLKRRCELGLFQKDVAARLRINNWTYLLWERDRTAPIVRYYPALFAFLGYDPFPVPISIPEKIAAKRRELGWSIKEAARQLGVDEGTFARWESGEWKPRMSVEVIKRFLNFDSTI
jgi:DNA-binding XRE family transcriptional regulator